MGDVPTTGQQPAVIICTEGRPDTAEVYGLTVQNPDHQMVKPISECVVCSQQPTCEAYGRAVRREKSG